MPIITDWFDSPREFAWETMESSLLEDIQGPQYYTYPLNWLLPYAYPKEEDLREGPSPMWITEIHPDSPHGVINERAEGSFVIDLPASFGEYLDRLQSSHRKKYRAVLRKNEDLSIEEGTQADIDHLWNHYTQRLSVLTARDGMDSYSQLDLTLRRDFYRSQHVRVLRMLQGNTLVAANVSLWRNGSIYDLACLIDTTASVSHRSLGSLAILRNIEFAIDKKVAHYDLLSRDYGYKRSYGAREVKLKHFVKGDDVFKRAYGLTSL